MWRTLAKRGQLVLPAPEDGIEFAGLVISEPLAEQPGSDTSCVEICIGSVTVRLESGAPISRIVAVARGLAVSS
ncbi:transposase IS3/IS911 family protein [Ochrobactrum quorumnocens]|jgi:transposase|uniref:Transposase IS3/IS911 family protein n=2 Tax=Ochrobactrum quorumnocens TaxID=271865 RepID=A0A248UE32_9HYPH|nr:transposase IS3/IS911 family protein [[Ochrobactrum] quorumnocens]